MPVSIWYNNQKEGYGLRYRKLHLWDVTPEEAIKIQQGLKRYICLKSAFTEIKKVAGADAAYHNGIVIAGVVVLEYPSLKIIESKYSVSPVTFPYIPGLLIFREGPALLKTFEKIKNKPDVIIFDGQGIAHPRRMGIATHLGILLDSPSIGCAKSILTGEYVSIGEEKGDFTILKDGSDTVGAVLRTKRGVSPVFVSPGHKIDIITSMEIILKCIGKHKLPEPVRQAHIFVKRVQKVRD